jgi:hypothetical protein
MPATGAFLPEQFARGEAPSADGVVAAPDHLPQDVEHCPGQWTDVLPRLAESLAADLARLMPHAVGPPAEGCPLPRKLLGLPA